MNHDTINAQYCPLCQQKNYCEQLNNKSNDLCWCQKSDVCFPDALLNKVPQALKGKACVCKNCAASFLIDDVSKPGAGVKNVEPSK